MTGFVDAFLYAGEQWALDARVQTLADLDVVHVAIVANRTHQGDPVQFLTPPTKNLRSTVFIDLSRFDDRTRGGAGRPDYQVRERAHRDDATALVCHAAEGHRLVMLSDVDEIPNPDILASIEPSDVAPGHVLCLAQRMHPWGPQWQYPGPWLGTTIATVGTASRQGLQWMRDARGTDACRIIGEDGLRGGWHLSWWGDDDARRAKLASFSHAELAHKAERLETYALIGRDINDLDLLPVNPDTVDWPVGINPADWLTWPTDHFNPRGIL